MAPVVASIEVDRPAVKVFTYATDPRRFHEWQKGVTAGHLEARDVSSVGARCVTTRRIGFVDRPITSEITQLNHPGHEASRALTGPSEPRWT